MNERAARFVCLVSGFISATVAWTLVVSLPLSRTVLTLFLIGLAAIMLVRKSLPRRVNAACYLSAGALLGGLLQLTYQVVRFPTDAASFEIDLGLTLAMVVFVALNTLAGYLVGSVFLRRKRPSVT